jgi:hypothetical protein
MKIISDAASAIRKLPSSFRGPRPISVYVGVSEMIYPLIEGRTYTIGQLRETEATLLKNRQNDQEFSAKLRTQRRSEISWAKSRSEEAYAILLFAKHAGISDEATLTFDPAAAADFEIHSEGATIKLQCTMAYEKRPGHDTGGRRHIRKMDEYNKLVLTGERSSIIDVDDAATQIANWRAGIADAITAKVSKERYVGQGLSLLVYARQCGWDNIDTPFMEIAGPAMAWVEDWRAVFKTVYIVDEHEFARFDARELQPSGG